MNREFDAIDVWRGLLDPMPPVVPAITLRAPISRAQSSGTGAFLGLASDGREYWFKVPGNAQGNQVLVNEVIVSGVGKLFEAPVAERALAWVPPSIGTWSEWPVARPGDRLVAHASRHVPESVDNDGMLHTRKDDNARRQASLLALWDLCVGDDEQWLYEAGGYSIWSYDHGLWFTTGEGDWDAAVLSKLVDIDGSFREVPTGLDNDHIHKVADRIAALTPEELLGVLSSVPIEWGTSKRDLEAMGWFLYRRAPAVAERTHRLADRGPSR